MISVIFISLCMVWSSSSFVIPSSQLILHNAPLPVFYHQSGIYNVKSGAINLPNPAFLNTAWPLVPGVKQSKIETLDEESESTTPAATETTEGSSSPNEEDGSYKPDNSGDYVPDNSGDYAQDDSGNYNPEIAEAEEVKVINPVGPYSFGFLPAHPYGFFNNARLIVHPIF